MSDLKVYFEKQGSGRLCGVHCLNSLLQGPEFTQSDLNKYASDLDKEEASLLSADSSKPPVPRTMTISSLSNQPKSDNVDSTGYFSLSVLERALKSKFNLTVENASRREVLNEIKNFGFENHDGFVIHLKDHWFSARAIPNNGGGRTWFFLDSLKTGPERVSENDLWGTLQGLIQSGNHVFVIRTPEGGSGRLPTSPPKTRYLSPHQYYLPVSEIHKQTQTSTTSFAVSEPPLAKITDWNSLGQGQSLSSTNNAPTALHALPSSTHTDEPPPGPSVVTIMVRYSGGKKVRRFRIDSSVADLWSWIAQWMPTARSLVGPNGLKLVPSDVQLMCSFLGGGEQVLFNLA